MRWNVRGSGDVDCVSASGERLGTMQVLGERMDGTPVYVWLLRGRKLEPEEAWADFKAWRKGEDR